MMPAVLSRATDLLDACWVSLWPACWQGGLVVLAVWAVTRLLPSMPARCQCWFWRLAMLKFVVVLLLPPLVNLPLLPAPAVVTHVEARLPAATTMPIMRQTEQLPVSVAQTAPWPSLPTILWCAWLIGVVGSFLRLSLAWNAARQLRKRGRAIADGPILEQLRIQTGLFGLRTAPRLIEVPGGGSPMLLGTFWPTIAIPAQTRLRLNAAEQTMVLGHELAHIRRGDLFWGLMASLIRAVFFFHPLAWLGQRQLKLAQEVAADRLAIAKQDHDAIGYGHLLVSVIEKLGSKMGPRPLVSTISLETAGPIHSLTRRLVAMSRIGRTSRRVLVGSGVLLGAVVLLGLVPWRLVAAEPQNVSWYAAKVRFTTRVKDQIEEVADAPTLTYRSGQSAFVAKDQFDKSQAMLVAVASLPEGQPGNHAIQVRWLCDPNGKEVTKEAIDWLAKQGTRHFPQIKPHQTVNDLQKGAIFALVLRGGGDSKSKEDAKSFVVSFSCDREARLIEGDGHEMVQGYQCWESKLLEVPCGATGTIRVTQADGSRSVDINVTVVPHEPSASAATGAFSGALLSARYDQTGDQLAAVRDDGCAPLPTPFASGTIAARTDADQQVAMYRVDLVISRTKKNGQKEVVNRPSICHLAGQPAYVSIGGETSVLEVSVFSTFDRRPVEHVIEARTLHYPKGHLMGTADKSGRKAPPAPLPTAFRDPDEGDRALQALSPKERDEMDRRNKEFRDAQEKDAVVVKSPKLVLTGSTTGKVTMIDADGSELEVEATILPVGMVPKPDGKHLPTPSAAPAHAAAAPQPLYDVGNVGKDKMTLAGYEAIPNPKNPDLSRRPYRMDADSYGIVVSNDAKGDPRIAGVNKRTGEWKWLEMPKNNQVLFEPIMGADVAAFIQHGDPLSQLVVYNGRLNKWSAFPLQDRVIDVIPCVGDRMVSYQLRDRVVAYSAAKDAWGMLLTEATVKVGDDGVFVDTADGRYVFPDKNGAWVAVKSSTAMSR